MKRCNEMAYPTRRRAYKALVRLNARLDHERPYVGSVFCERCQMFHLSKQNWTRARCGQKKYETFSEALSDLPARNRVQASSGGRKAFKRAYLCEQCDFYHLA